MAMVLPLVFAHARLPETGHARISVFDAGRGTMVLIATHSRVVLFDTGDSWGTEGARLRQLAMPALDALGTRSIDLLVLPRLDADRAQGAASFERAVRDIRVGGGWPASRLGARACDDERFRWDGVDFVLSAAGPGRRACELQVTVGDHSMRFAEKWIETSARLVIATGGQAPSRPRKFVLDRWRASGARHFDTRDDGAIEIGLGTQGIVVTAVARVSRYPFAWRRFP
jgi:beta-lactamase superfamily II metal-dependent hydrolase